MPVLLLCSLPSFAATLSIAPDTVTAFQGNVFTLDVVVAGVTDLAAYQFDVLFPTFLNVNSVSTAPGSFFDTNGIGVGYLDLDNTNGTLTYVFNALSGGGPGLTGDGILARIEFTAIAAGGPGQITLADPGGMGILFDTTYSIPLDVTLQGASVSVNEVPEPGTQWLLAFGAAMCFIGRRCTRAKA